ncbi:MAG: branched-chain amino acid aminotransferase [Euryarchaeota archaeon]|nr:branched-chain amino acid aminotransferase [Euryarchaeota archaeon]
MGIKVTKAKRSRIGSVDFDNLGFGEHFSDHMLSMEYAGGAWSAPEIVPYGKLSVHPALCSFHYGQLIFEGLKAYRRPDGLALFRPRQNFERLNRSAARLCMPPVDVDTVLEGLVRLVRLDRKWVPRKEGQSLYIRPFMFGSSNFLGVRASDAYRLLIITSPVGAFYKAGFNPVKLCTPGGYIRAAPGGLGEAKTAANYAASLLPAEEAKRRGFHQVLWLDARKNRYIEESGAMNVMFLIGDELVTAPLDGTILPGITRESVMEIARSWGIKVSERPFTIDEVFAASKGGTLREAFGTGTAAVISPIGEIAHGDARIVINGGRTGPLAQRLYDEITGIQYGTRPDRFGWVMRI